MFVEHPWLNWIRQILYDRNKFLKISHKKCLVLAHGWFHVKSPRKLQPFFFSHQLGPSGPSWSVSHCVRPFVSDFVCPIPMRFFSRPLIALGLRSHDQILASQWSPPPKKKVKSISYCSNKNQCSTFFGDFLKFIF